MVDIAQFDENGDFLVWKVSMMALMSHNECDIVIESVEEWSDEQKANKKKIMKEAYNPLVFGLSDEILRKVCTKCDAHALWSRLNDLYVAELMNNLAYLKAALFSFKMDYPMSIDANLDDFLKMSLLLNGTTHQLDETSSIMVLPKSLLDDYVVVKDAR